MATGVNIKMGVSGVSDFKRHISEAKESVKSLDEALKLCEAQFQATGDKETYLRDKADLLRQKLERQREVAEKAKEALQAMSDNGVDKSSTAFQKMQQECLRAESELIKTKTELDNVKSGGNDAADKVKSMNDRLQEIGKNVSFKNVTDGLKDIYDGFERAGRAAINLGKKVLSSAKGSTGFADEIKTIVDQYSDLGLTAENYQRMLYASDSIDTPVNAILAAWQRMNRALSTDAGKKSLEEVLGIGLNGQTSEDLFWEIGDALMNMGDAFDKEGAAQKMFGQSWRDLLPLFRKGRDEYEQTLAKQTVLTNEQIESLSEADDAIKEVERQIETLKHQFWAENADKISDLMNWVVENKDGLVTAITAIGGAMAAIKIAEFALNVEKVVKGFQTLWDGSNKKLPDVPTAPPANPGTDGSTDVVTTGGAGGIWASFKALMSELAPVVATETAVVLAATAPALIAQGKAQALNESLYQSRMTNAQLLDGQSRQFLERSAAALGMKRDENGNLVKNGLGQGWIGGNEAEIEAILYGMANRTDLEKAKLYNLLNGSTANGNSTWSELQRLWNGEAMDMGQMTAILSSVTDAYDRAALLANEMMNATTKAAESNLTREDMNEIRNMPKEVSNAVQAGMRGIGVYIDGQRAGNLLTPYISQGLGASLLGRTGP